MTISKEQMLSALELFQYSFRFRNQKFVVCLQNANDLRQIMTDLRVLLTSHIRTVLVTRATSELDSFVEDWGAIGPLFTRHENLVPSDAKFAERAFGDTTNFGVPILVQSEGMKDSLENYAFLVAEAIDASKVFFVGPWQGLTVDGELVSHTTAEDLKVLLEGSKEFSVDCSLLELLLKQKKRLDIDVQLLLAESGALFEEIFTHRGSGTLISSSYTSGIRQAEKTDVLDIALLMKPYIESGNILSVSENELAAEIHSLSVYEVNGAIVASAKLIDYGEVVELARLVALPRYQGRGRAKELVGHLLELARKGGKKWAFALSTEDRVGEFFKGLGFSEIPREQLPDAWQKGYDFKRPSKAYQINLEIP